MACLAWTDPWHQKHPTPLGMNWNTDCELDLVARHQYRIALMHLRLNGSKLLLSGYKGFPQESRLFQQLIEGHGFGITCVTTGYGYDFQMFLCFNQWTCTVYSKIHGHFKHGDLEDCTVAVLQVCTAQQDNKNELVVEFCMICMGLSKCLREISFSALTKPQHENFDKTKLQRQLGYDHLSTFPKHFNW